MRLIASFLLVLALSGCAMDVHKLHDLNPPADDFPSALASEYKDYADSELEQGRRFSAEHFAGKGLASLKGGAVEPEPVDTALPAEEQQSLTDARAMLEKFLTDDMKRKSPQKLARAQLLFDCWQDELSKGLDQNKAPCADEFRSSIAELQEMYDAGAYREETNQVIVFDAGSVKLNDAAEAAIAEVAQNVSGMPHYRVKLLAYTGVTSLQRKMTEKRLGVVRRALVKAGVGNKHIRMKKAGGKAVLLSSDTIAMDTKKITILVKTHDKPQTKPATTAKEH